ncbi:MAG: hypothetical protein Q9183_005089 [Haloplaca sp. 2 TL-2023]
MTIIEKIDPEEPSHGDVPGTAAHQMRQADAVPDLVIQSPKSKATFGGASPSSALSPEVPVPTTVVTKVDEEPRHGEVPGTEAYNMRTEDAEPDVVETKGDPSVRRDSPIAADGGFGRMPDESDEASTAESHTQDQLGAPIDGNGDDFDDFEAGGEEDDFGDFDDGFEEPLAEPDAPKPEAPSISTTPFPPISFDSFASLDTLLEATNAQMKALFPNTKPPPSQSADPPSGPPPSLFLTDRSHSLFTQLTAPPPLSPPNWLRSRTRRLFLVSLGVPIDLDEILPKSKQKKLVLPSTLREDSEHRRSESRRRGKIGLRGETNASSTSLASQSKEKKRRKGGNHDGLPPHPPPMDWGLVDRLCATTAEALSGMEDQELRAHGEMLEEMTRKAEEVLEYWVRRREAAMAEKEMFESVIGDLVKHARRVRR